MGLQVLVIKLVGILEAITWPIHKPLTGLD
jgi:hypothetical protein